MHIPPFHTIVDVTTRTVAIAAFVCNVLPKSTVFNDYPRVKAAYETGINFIIGLAFNWRECMPSLNLKMPFVPGFGKQTDVANPPVGPVLK